MYVGIDISKHKHTFAIATKVDGKPEIIKEAQVFDNSHDGFYLLLKALQSVGGQIKIGFESTGHYSVNLKHFLIEHGYSFMEVNPVLIKRFSESTTIRKTKTDKIDAITISKYLATVDYNPTSTKYYHIYHLKSLTRMYNKQVSDLGKAKVELRNLLDQAFPEFQKFFTDLYGKTPLLILKKAKSLKQIANLSNKQYDLYRKSSQGKFSYPRFLKLKDLAKTSIGVDSKTLFFQIHLAIDKIENLQEMVLMLEHEIKETFSYFNSKMTSIPGLGTISAAIILAEVSDFNNFSNPDKLVSFAGLDNSIYESGTTTKLGKITKRGSHILRATLFKVSMPILANTKMFYAYYHKKRSEGKHHTLALIHVCRKLLRVIYKLETTNTTFKDI